MKNVQSMIELGLRVCMLPIDLPGKDLNELRQQNFTESELLDIIIKNTYQGLQAKMKFNIWKNV